MTPNQMSSALVNFPEAFMSVDVLIAHTANTALSPVDEIRFPAQMSQLLLSFGC